MKRKENVYALYKGDTFIDVGTADELAERRGVSKETIKFYAMPINVKRAKSKDTVIVAYKLEDEDGNNNI